MGISNCSATSPPRLHGSMIYRLVAAPLRSEGVGRAMFEWAIRRARERGCVLVQLTTDRTRSDALVRPAWARSWRCKSSRKLTMASEAKHNCERVTDRGEEVR